MFLSQHDIVKALEINNGKLISQTDRRQKSNSEKQINVISSSNISSTIKTVNYIQYYIYIHIYI